MRISVIVPSYRRSVALRRCLVALTGQARSADELIVVRRTDDADTGTVLSDQFPEVTEITCEQPGLVAAMQAGAARASGDVIAFTDDDAIAPPDWTQRLLAAFADPDVGGAGGRDIVHEDELQPPLTVDVGRITRWGKLVGNHHLGTGPPREVLVLKGVNMAFRREALALPASLHGSGSQPHSEISICLWARRRGWRIVYDPAIVVDHYPQHRPAGDTRKRAPFKAVEDDSYNLVATLLSLEPTLFWRRALYGLAVGDRRNPGVGRALAALFGWEDLEIIRKLLPSVVGQLNGLIDIGRGRRITMIPVADAAARHAFTPRR